MKCPFSIFLCLLEAFEAETCRECCKKCGNKRFRASKITCLNVRTAPNQCCIKIKEKRRLVDLI